MPARAAERSGELAIEDGSVQALHDARVWPDGEHVAVLFLLDVQSDDERALLEDRVRAASLGAGARVECARLDEADRLDRLLADLPDACWLQPLF